MIDTSSTLVGIVFGCLVVLIAFSWNKFSKACSSEREQGAPAEPLTQLEKKPQIQERIRQIALIEKDEFNQFYKPLIEKVMLYLNVLSRACIEGDYFEQVFKALRKRRSTIFEYGSSERDQKNKALWTFALFCAISIRYVIKEYQSCQFKINGNLVNPYLLAFKDLENCEVVIMDHVSVYRPSTVQIHLIDKVLSTWVIDRLEKSGIYPFVINAVSGFYHERLNPFYSIIEQVEAHMEGTELKDNQLFEGNIKIVLKLIEQNTFSKNTEDSFVFEAMSHLLIDRNFLWELYRGYSISESKPLGKKDFEQQLTASFSLGQSMKNNTTFTFTLDKDKLDIRQERISLELRNMVALAYTAVPYYRFTDRKKVKRNVLQRDIAVGDVSRGSVEEQDSDSSLCANDPRSLEPHVIESPSDSVGLKDLFSE